MSATEPDWRPDDRIEFTVSDPYMGLTVSPFVLQHIGRITLILGDTDDVLALCWNSLGLNGRAAAVLKKTLSEKSGEIRKVAQANPGAPWSKLAIEIADLLDTILPRRNYATHGIWGYYVMDDEGLVRRPGAFCANRSTEAPFYAEEILSLHEQVVDVNHKAHRLSNQLRGLPDRDPLAERPPITFFSSRERAEKVIG